MYRQEGPAAPIWVKPAPRNVTLWRAWERRGASARGPLSAGWADHWSVYGTRGRANAGPLSVVPIQRQRCLEGSRDLTQPARECLLPGHSLCTASWDKCT
ncbi:hypothetical protein GCM10018952_32270 [Streptosporangium vulgare]